MTKTRLEALTDGVFAIAITLLVIEIHVPDIAQGETLLSALSHLSSLFMSYGVSFIILTMFWISHHGFYANFVKTVNRQLILLNSLLLFFISLIPFSAHLIGKYSHETEAIVLYGIHIILLSCTSLLAFRYVMNTPQIENHEVSSRLIKQASIRVAIPIVFSMLGIVLAFVSTPLAFVAFGFPILFNIIPGSLDAIEKFFGIEIQ